MNVDQRFCQVEHNQADETVSRTQPMSDAWQWALDAGWNPPEDDGFWWREKDGQREVSYTTPLVSDAEVEQTRNRHD